VSIVIVTIQCRYRKQRLSLLQTGSTPHVTLFEEETRKEIGKKTAGAEKRGGKKNE